MENALFEIDRISKIKSKRINIDYYISDNDNENNSYVYENAPNINKKFIIIAVHDIKYLEIK